jgi:glycerophosphoryl diester phosphodiesterase
VVQQRLPSLRWPPLAFAHRGASAHARENTLEAFRLARRLGATGLESDVWITADGVPVLDHDGVVRNGLRRRGIGEVERRDLPAHIPSLEELYAECGTDYELSLDVKDAAAAEAVVAVARAAGDGVAGRLWLCHPELEVVAGWRPLGDDVRLVDSTRLKRIKEGVERRAARLAQLGVDALNLHHTDWSGGMVALVHRFERFALAWDLQHPPVLETALRMGVDGIYSDHVDRMVDALAALPPNPPA